MTLTELERQASRLFGLIAQSIEQANAVGIDEDEKLRAALVRLHDDWPETATATEVEKLERQLLEVIDLLDELRARTAAQTELLEQQLHDLETLDDTEPEKAAGVIHCVTALAALIAGTQQLTETIADASQALHAARRTIRLWRSRLRHTSRLLTHRRRESTSPPPLRPLCSPRTSNGPPARTSTRPTNAATRTGCAVQQTPHTSHTRGLVKS